MNVEAGKLLEFVRVGGIFTAIVVLFVTWFLGRSLRDITSRVGETFVAQRLVVEQVSAFVRFGIYVVGTLLAVRSVFDLSKEVLTVVGGTFVVTVGLVLKDQAASILAGVMLLVEKPFQVGDRVTFGGYYGTITSIGLRSVRLVTLDDNEVSIPNSKFLTDPVASGNSGELTMLVQMDFFIGIDQDVASAKRLLEDAVTSSCYFYADKPWVVLVNQVNLDMVLAVRLRAKAYVLELRYEKAFESDVSQRVLQAFDEATILPPAILHRSLAPESARGALGRATMPPLAK